jgi:hypothetical protein
MLLSVLCVIIQVIWMLWDRVVFGPIVWAWRCPVAAESFALSENYGPSAAGAGTSDWRKGCRRER